MNRTMSAIFVVLVTVLTFGIAGCGGGEKSEAPETAQGKSGSYASKSREAGQPIDHSEEISRLEQALKQNPEDWQALSGVGDSYFGLRRFEEAIEYYKKSIEINPDDIDSYNDIGLAYHYLGKSTEGVEMIDEGIKRNPYYQRIYLTKGFILAYGAGDLEAAKAAWEKGRGIDPESQVGKAAADFLAQFSEKK